MRYGLGARYAEDADLARYGAVGKFSTVTPTSWVNPLFAYVLLNGAITYAVTAFAGQIKAKVRPKIAGVRTSATSFMSGLASSAIAFLTGTRIGFNTVAHIVGIRSGSVVRKVRTAWANQVHGTRVVLAQVKNTNYVATVVGSVYETIVGLRSKTASVGRLWGQLAKQAIHSPRAWTGRITGKTKRAIQFIRTNYLSSLVGSSYQKLRGSRAFLGYIGHVIGRSNVGMAAVRMATAFMQHITSSQIVIYPVILQALVSYIEKFVGIVFTQKSVDVDVRDKSVTVGVKTVN